MTTVIAVTDSSPALLMSRPSICFSIFSAWEFDVTRDWLRLLVVFAIVVGTLVAVVKRSRRRRQTPWELEAASDDAERGGSEEAPQRRVEAFPSKLPERALSEGLEIPPPERFDELERFAGCDEQALRRLEDEGLYVREPGFRRLSQGLHSLFGADSWIAGIMIPAGIITMAMPVFILVIAFRRGEHYAPAFIVAVLFIPIGAALVWIYWRLARTPKEELSWELEFDRMANTYRFASHGRAAAGPLSEIDCVFADSVSSGGSDSPNKTHVSVGYGGNGESPQITHLPADVGVALARELAGFLRVPVRFGTKYTNALLREERRILREEGPPFRVAGGGDSDLVWEDVSGE